MPILFTLYLSWALSSDNNSEEHVRNHPELPPNLRDQCYSSLQRTGTLIRLQYADDICWLGMNCKQSVESVREKIPRRLAERNLLINNNKYEGYVITKDGDQQWKKCKYFGTMLDTTEDIKRWKRMANNAMQKIKYIVKD